MPLGGERGALSHAETMLFIGDHKTQMGKFHALRNERMGSDGKVNLSCGQLGSDGSFGSGFGGAG